MPKLSYCCSNSANNSRWDDEGLDGVPWCPAAVTDTDPSVVPSDGSGIFKCRLFLHFALQNKIPMECFNVAYDETLFTITECKEVWEMGSSTVLLTYTMN